MRRAFNPCATTDSGDGLPGDVAGPHAALSPTQVNGPVRHALMAPADQERATFGLGFFSDGHISDVNFPYTRLQGTGQIRWKLYQLRCQFYLW